MPDDDQIPSISNDDFMAGLLKSAKDRGISVIAIYGYDEAGRSVMKMKSTEPEEVTKATLREVLKSALKTDTRPLVV
jgi:hypothetical protein